jgi:predicted esterase
MYDPSIPYELAIEGRGLLNAAGADLVTWDGPIGHGIAPEELAAAVQWIEMETSKQTDT